MRRLPKLKPEQRVTLAVAKERALGFLRHERSKGHVYIKASAVADAIWPGANFKSQGAGAAASRILVLLKKDGKVTWHRSRSKGDWGWTYLYG